MQDEKNVACPLCKKGKLACKVCRGKGDDPDPAIALPCMGCLRKDDFAIAPGKWSCPSCNGHGTYEIIGGAKSAKCAVCSGDRFFDCTICGGSALMPRLFPIPKSAKPEAATKIVATGKAWFAKQALGTREMVSVLEIETQGRGIAPIFAIAGRLQAGLDRAEYLQKNAIKGSQEVSAFFRGATALGLQEALAADKAELDKE